MPRDRCDAGADPHRQVRSAGTTGASRRRRHGERQMTDANIPRSRLIEALIPSTVPVEIIRKIASRFPDARQILLSGSHAKGCPTPTSDIDVFVFLPKVSEVLREVVMIDDHLVDLAVHDFGSLRRVLAREHAMSVCALADEVANGILLMPSCEAMRSLRAYGNEILQEGPKPFDLDSLRSHLLGQTADLRQSRHLNEKRAIALGLAFKLMLFALRARGGWIGSGRHLARDLDRLAPGFIDALAAATFRSLAGMDDEALIHEVEIAVRMHFGSVDRQWRCRAPAG
ncbi:hypothetical protein CDL60_09665 [Roseateles noduli]|nr:hypothetical protein CDL60_09665 [Roseateles noduli]